MGDLERQLQEWPVTQAAAGIVTKGGYAETVGDPDWVRPLASITKILVAYAGLIAFEEGTIDFAEAVDTQNATAEHLLAHAAGYPFDGPTPRFPVGKRRIYSNYGIERFGELLEQRSGMTTAEYLKAGVLAPLGMDNTELNGSPAHGARSCVADLMRFMKELLTPTLIDPTTLAMGTSTHFPELAGVVPGFGSYDPNQWGLGFEIKGSKDPHWTSPKNSAQTFGHFGGAGTFIWVDPAARVGCVVITDRSFDEWAIPLWPAFSGEVLDHCAKVPR